MMWRKWTTKMRWIIFVYYIFGYKSLKFIYSNSYSTPFFFFGRKVLIQQLHMEIPLGRHINQTSLHFDQLSNQPNKLGDKLFKMVTKFSPLYSASLSKGPKRKDILTKLIKTNPLWDAKSLTKWPVNSYSTCVR